MLTTSEYLHGEDTGFCLHCGVYAEGGVEPDARQYECEICEQPKVYGLQELLIMDLLLIEDEESAG